MRHETYEQEVALKELLQKLSEAKLEETRGVKGISHQQVIRRLKQRSKTRHKFLLPSSIESLTSRFDSFLFIFLCSFLVFLPHGDTWNNEWIFNFLSPTSSIDNAEPLKSTKIEKAKKWAKRADLLYQLEDGADFSYLIPSPSQGRYREELVSSEWTRLEKSLEKGFGFLKAFDLAAFRQNKIQFWKFLGMLVFDRVRQTGFLIVGEGDGTLAAALVGSKESDWKQANPNPGSRYEFLAGHLLAGFIVEETLIVGRYPSHSMTTWPLHSRLLGYTKIFPSARFVPVESVVWLRLGESTPKAFQKLIATGTTEALILLDGQTFSNNELIKQIEQLPRKEFIVSEPMNIEWYEKTVISSLSGDTSRLSPMAEEPKSVKEEPQSLRKEPKRLQDRSAGGKRQPRTTVSKRRDSRTQTQQSSTELTKQELMEETLGEGAQVRISLPGETDWYDWPELYQRLRQEAGRFSVRFDSLKVSYPIIGDGTIDPDYIVTEEGKIKVRIKGGSYIFLSSDPLKIHIPIHSLEVIAQIPSSKQRSKGKSLIQSAL